MRETILASFALAIWAVAVGAQAPDEHGSAPPLGAPVVEKLYADAVALGFGDKQVVDADFSALVARAESYQLQRIYADAVSANAEPLSVVRQSLRELGHRREVWEEWPAKKANIIYALSIVSGGEPDSVLRERLYAIRDRGVAEKLYAEAVVLGFGDKQVVDADFSALVARAESYQLQRIYANAVLANAEPLSVVRRSLRELGHRREVWEEWPAKKANTIYGLSIVSGGEPDSVLRERLYAIRDRGAVEPPIAAAEGEDEGKGGGLASVSQPSKSDDRKKFCGADCGQDDPEHPFYWVYETDMYQEWQLWYEWFHGGPCPSCWTPWELLVDAKRIEAIISEACEISDELSLVSHINTLYHIIITRPDSAVGRYWIRKLSSWAAKAGHKFILTNVTGLGAAANTLWAVCRIRDLVQEAEDD